MENYHRFRRQLRFPRGQISPDFFSRIGVVQQQDIDAAIGHFRQGLTGGWKKAGALTVNFPAVIPAFAPRRIVLLGFGGATPTNRDALAIDILFLCRLAKSEEGLSVAESHDHDALRFRVRSQIIKQRQIKTRRPAGIKFRLESAKARQLFEHRQAQIATGPGRPVNPLN